MLHLSDIPLPEGVEIPELAQGPEHDQAIVSIQVVHMAPIEDEEEGEEVSAEVPTVSEEEDEGEGDEGES